MNMTPFQEKAKYLADQGRQYLITHISLDIDESHLPFERKGEKKGQVIDHFIIESIVDVLPKVDETLFYEKGTEGEKLLTTALTHHVKVKELTQLLRDMVKDEKLSKDDKELKMKLIHKDIVMLQNKSYDAICKINDTYKETSFAKLI